MCEEVEENYIKSNLSEIDDESDGKPSGERWDPLGAANEEILDNLNSCGEIYDEFGQGFQSFDINRIKTLEDEQEVLTSSLLALTSHFAQVQFRLRQIVDSPANERDSLLKNLEEFAFRGIPEINNISNPINAQNSLNSEIQNQNDYTIQCSNTSNVLNLIETQRLRQHELINQLKTQLNDLEKYAYENGDIVLPQSILMEKQKIIIDELKNKLNVNFDEKNIKNLTNVDSLNKQQNDDLVNPLKLKEQLVDQLKTQISDLEDFISYLQNESNKYESTMEEISEKLSRDDGDGKYDQEENETTFNLESNKTHSKISKKQNDNQMENCKKNIHDAERMKWKKISHTGESDNRAKIQQNDNFNNRAFNILSKASTILQIFAVTQFGCGGTSHTRSNPVNQQTNDFQRNILKKTNKFNHWGDIRAQLEVDIQEIIALMKQIKLLFVKNHNNKYLTDTSDENNEDDDDDDRDDDDEDDDDDDDDDDEDDNFNISKIKMSEKYNTMSTELTTLVRKNFAMTLKKLMQHGLYNDNETYSIVPFIGCFSSSHSNYSKRKTYSQNERYHNNSNQDNDDDDAYAYFDMSNDENIMHPWELILEYYHLKNGDKYNELPARKLSQSFNLDIVGSSAISNKQSLLSAIGSIISLHSPYKRSYNAHFKAFVCAGLNSHKLCQWLNLIFQSNEIISLYYTNWSYVACTSFRDALKSMDRLSKFDFDLPVDLAIRQFQNIKDVFM